MSNVSLVWATPDAEKMIVKMARVSNPANEDNQETAPKLLRYLIKHKHISPFEMANMCLKIETERDIAAQILRHRSFSFQEFCLAGKAKITVYSEAGVVQRIPIETLYRKWQNPKFKARQARSYDPTLERFIIAPIKNVYNSGKKTVYEFLIKGPASERMIHCTREHRVLTKEKGFVPFGVAFDEGLTVALNGAAAQPLPYQDIEVLKAKAWMGSSRFAKEHGIAEVTARKWFRKYGIKPYKPCNAPASAIDSSFSSRLHSFMKWARKELRASHCEHCGHDGSIKRLEISHIRAHDQDPSLAFDPLNLQTLCSACHRRHDISVQGKQYGWTLGMTAKWGNITSQRCLGVQETYDIEMDHPTHNFVADGVVVHNSTRYAVTGGAEPPSLRRQDIKNRQNSFDDLAPIQQEYWGRIIGEYLEEGYDIYERMLGDTIAKETARRILPLCTPTTLYMNGTLRSWITYIALREKSDTQLEHRQIALSAKQVFSEQFPVVAEALGGSSDWSI